MARSESSDSSSDESTTEKNKARLDGSKAKATRSSSSDSSSSDSSRDSKKVEKKTRTSGSSVKRPSARDSRAGCEEARVSDGRGNSRSGRADSRDRGAGRGDRARSKERGAGSRDTVSRRRTSKSPDRRDRGKISPGRYRNSRDRSRNRTSLDRSKTVRDRSRTSHDRTKSSRDRTKSSRDRTKSSRDRTKSSRDRTKSSRERTNASRDRINASRDRTNSSRDRINSSRDRTKSSRDRSGISRDRSRISRDRSRISRDRSRISRDRSRISRDRSRDRARTSRDRSVDRSNRRPGERRARSRGRLDRTARERYERVVGGFGEQPRWRDPRFSAPWDRPPLRLSPRRRSTDRSRRRRSSRRLSRSRSRGSSSRRRRRSSRRSTSSSSSSSSHSSSGSSSSSSDSSRGSPKKRNAADSTAKSSKEEPPKMVGKNVEVDNATVKDDADKTPEEHTKIVTASEKNNSKVVEEVNDSLVGEPKVSGHVISEAATVGSKPIICCKKESASLELQKSSVGLTVPISSVQSEEQSVDSNKKVVKTVVDGTVINATSGANTKESAAVPPSQSCPLPVDIPVPPAGKKAADIVLPKLSKPKTQDVATSKTQSQVVPSSSLLEDMPNPSKLVEKASPNVHSKGNQQNAADTAKQLVLAKSIAPSQDNKVHQDLPDPKQQLGSLSLEVPCKGSATQDEKHGSVAKDGVAQDGEQRKGAEIDPTRSEEKATKEGRSSQQEVAGVSTSHEELSNSAVKSAKSTDQVPLPSRRRFSTEKMQVKSGNQHQEAHQTGSSKKSLDATKTSRTGPMEDVQKGNCTQSEKEETSKVVNSKETSKRVDDSGNSTVGRKEEQKERKSALYDPLETASESADDSENEKKTMELNLSCKEMATDSSITTENMQKEVDTEQMKKKEPVPHKDQQVSDNPTSPCAVSSKSKRDDVGASQTEKEQVNDKSNRLGGGKAEGRIARSQSEEKSERQDLLPDNRNVTEGHENYGKRKDEEEHPRSVDQKNKKESDQSRSNDKKRTERDDSRPSDSKLKNDPKDSRHLDSKRNDNRDHSRRMDSKREDDRDTIRLEDRKKKVEVENTHLEVTKQRDLSCDSHSEKNKKTGKCDDSISNHDDVSSSLSRKADAHSLKKNNEQDDKNSAKRKVKDSCDDQLSEENRDVRADSKEKNGKHVNVSSDRSKKKGSREDSSSDTLKISSSKTHPLAKSKEKKGDDEVEKAGDTVKGHDKADKKRLSKKKRHDSSSSDSSSSSNSSNDSSDSSSDSGSDKKRKRKTKSKKNLEIVTDVGHSSQNADKLKKKSKETDSSGDSSEEDDHGEERASSRRKKTSSYLKLGDVDSRSDKPQKKSVEEKFESRERPRRPTEKLARRSVDSKDGKKHKKKKSVRDDSSGSADSDKEVQKKKRKRVPKKKSKKHRHGESDGVNSDMEADRIGKSGKPSAQNDSEEELLRKKRKIEEQLRIEMERKDKEDRIQVEKKLAEVRDYEREHPELKKQENKERQYHGDEVVGERYWGGQDTRPSRQSKTSDTYWNKYADELGIQIEDPKRRRDLDRPDRPTKRGRDDRDADGEEDGSRKRTKGRSAEREGPKEEAPKPAPAIKKPVLDPLQTRTGGAYIPPAKLRMMQADITDKSSAAYQRLAWEALKKSINGLVNKVNVSNIGIIVRELLKENVVRGRGILCRSLMQAQAFSLTFTHVYAALVSVLNSKFPQIGELLLKRLVIQFRRGIKRNDKNICLSSTRFIAHLMNQEIAHEVVALEILTFLLEKVQDVADSTEIGEKSRNNCAELAASLLKECGQKLQEVSPRCMLRIFESLKNIINEGKLEERVKYMFEAIWIAGRGGFKDNPAVIEELDLVEEDDQITHIVELDGKLESDDILNVFKHDLDFVANEEKYKEIKSSILGGSSDESGSEGEDGSESEEEEDEDEAKEQQKIIDQTEGNMLAFRRTIYLTLKSSITVDEAAHKILKGEIKPGWELELCNMILDCCAQERTFIKFFALLAQRFCNINRVYMDCFQEIFTTAYETCHRLDAEKLRNVARLFAHLFVSDAINWAVFSVVKLDEDNTTSSSRVFLKILFQEMAEFFGLSKLNERLRDPTLSAAYEGLLPRDNPRNTRFAINFFTSIGLGGLTDGLREFLRTQPKPTAIVAPVLQKGEGSGESSDSSSSDSSDSSSSSSDSSSSSSNSSSSDSDSSSSSSDDDRRRRRKRQGRGERDRRPAPGLGGSLSERRDAGRREEGAEEEGRGRDNSRRRGDRNPPPRRSDARRSEERSSEARRPRITEDAGDHKRRRERRSSSRGDQRSHARQRR